MGADPVHEYVHIDQDGRLLASADVSTDLDAPPPTVAKAALHLEAGHLPAHTGRDLVDAVLALPQAQASDHLTAITPAGDSELLDRIRSRTGHVQTRSVGATAITEADLPARPLDT